MSGLLLAEEELVELTGRRRRDAQARELEHMRIPFGTRKDGSLVVLRVVVEKAFGADGTIAPTQEPEPELQP